MHNVRRHLILLCAGISLCTAACCGCSRKQDYRVVRPDAGEAALAGKAFVVEGTLGGVTSRTPPIGWRQWLFGLFIPLGAPASDRLDAHLAVEHVRRGDFRTPSLPLRALRLPTADEVASAFPEDYALFNGLRLRIGYDRRRGDAFTGLTLVPLEVAQPYRDALQRARAARAARPATKPATAR